ncbi:MAG: fluoride efflux transporter CrcB [Bacteroidia bacterium]|nr:fluoride efflux transporter CrcB [Bacteroidota bacterium]MBL7949531.1 fluoride efflux transporter CrcB [Bacteroidia bacterium]MBP6009979.1 fluoride efflux transporter CrcB [Bacteroidia bacterium]MBP7269511.1 fluoride efflux transporter CrcB [Bacteroidia bacterium]MBP7437888.1 fluoride efflux transporter CrcB [Bacteroidia bacterium]
MNNVLLLALGGAMGTIARYGTGLWINRTLEQPLFPWGTFAINLTGCLVIGLLAGMNERNPFEVSARLFLFTGLLGGFTTFSAFGLESVQLIRNGHWQLAGLYAGSSTLVGILFAYAGYRLTMGGR